eukprot:evm.model.NODE_8960_length_34018_cov_18.461050.9
MRTIRGSLSLTAKPYDNVPASYSFTRAASGAKAALKVSTSSELRKVTDTTNQKAPKDLRESEREVNGDN